MTASMSRSRSSADGVHVGQDDMSVEEARRLLGPAPFIGLSIRTEAAGGGGAARHSRLCRDRRCLWHDLEDERQDARSGSRGFAGVIQVFRHRIGNFPTCGIAGITAAERRSGDRRRRRRRLRHLGAVLSSRPRCRRARASRRGRCRAEEIRAQGAGGRRASPRRCDGRRRMTSPPAPHPHRGHHRRLGLRRRRRHPGRPENLLRARRLRRFGDRGAHGAEHQRRQRGLRGAAGIRRRADRCGVLRPRRRRGEDRYARQCRSRQSRRGRAVAITAQTRIVLDPVMVATSGDRLLTPDAVEAMRTTPRSTGAGGDAEPARGGGAARCAGGRDAKTRWSARPSACSPWGRKRRADEGRPRQGR